MLRRKDAAHTLRLACSAPCLTLAVAMALALTGCQEIPEPPERVTSSGLPEWHLDEDDIVLYEVSSTKKHEYLSIRFSPEVPCALGNTIVSDFTILMRDPMPGQTRLTEDIECTLARSPDIANLRTAFIDAYRGTIRLSERGEHGFSGSAKIEFLDTLHDDAPYIVVAKFSPVD